MSPEKLIDKILNKKIKLVVKTKIYNVVIKEILSEDKFIGFPKEDLGESYLGVKGEILVDIEDKTYSFDVLVWTPSMKKMVFQKISEITENKRKQERISIGQVSAKIVKHGILEDEIFDGFIVDLSLDGAQIWTKEELKMNEKYILMTMLDNKEIKCVFEIKRCEKKGSVYQYGVKFIEISEKDLNRIKRYLQKLGAIEYPGESNGGIDTIIEKLKSFENVKNE